MNNEQAAIGVRADDGFWSLSKSAAAIASAFVSAHCASVVLPPVKKL
jgi:hypothetical protein